MAVRHLIRGLGVLATGFTAMCYAAAPTYHAPRTLWNTPDLQGTWTTASLTALERADSFKGKATLSPAEVAEFEKTNDFAKFSAEDAKPTDTTQKAKAGADPGGYNAFWLDPGTKLAVVNGEARTSFIIDPADGKIPYTPAGQQAFRARTMRMSMDGPETRALGERCLLGFGPTGGPPMLPDVYNNNYQIVQNQDTVVILVEMVHDARIIRIGGKHVPDNMTPWLGDSIGHWEGDTLVVETKNMNPQQQTHYGIKQRLYVPATAKIVERFTRVAPNQILYRFTVADSTAYTQPWTGEVPMIQTKDHIYEYACHEGNYALPGILAGAREGEKRAEK
jgi:hypothetical protein